LSTAVDGGRTLTRGAEDLVAVEDPLLGRFVEVGGGLDAGRVRTRTRLGDRHGTPDRVSVLAKGLQESGALFAGTRGADRRATECGGRHAEIETAVAPTHLFDLDADRDEAIARIVGA